MNILNLGCGNKYHENHINVDLHSTNPLVFEHNILNDLPFEDNVFDAVYCSQVLEHINFDSVDRFLGEIRRVLKYNGIVRIVVPDLENIAKEYLLALEKVIYEPNNIVHKLNYDWMILELYDQTVREKNGGLMATFLKAKELANEDFVLNRIGNVGREIRKNALNNANIDHDISRDSIGSAMFKKLFRKLTSINGIRSLILKILLSREEKNQLKIGRFRLNGEIHYWMYDRYSLKVKLEQIGFSNVKKQSPFQSDIKDWEKYSLDVKDGMPYDPVSLFIEATKV